MPRTTRIAAATLAVMAVVVACKTTYTEADVEAAEARRDAALRAEDVRAGERGVNEEVFDEEREYIEEESER